MSGKTVLIADDDPHLGSADVGIEELVAAPGIGRQNRPHAKRPIMHRLAEEACHAGQHRRAPATVALQADACAVERRMPGQDADCRGDVPGRGRERELCLVGHRRGHATCAEGIEHEGRDAHADKGLSMLEMRCRDAQAARHDDDHRRFALRLCRQEQLAVDSDARHRRRIADRLPVVQRIGAGNVDRLAPHAIGEDDVAVAKALRCAHRSLTCACRIIRW